MWGRLDEAEDLCQETFTRVVAAAVELRDPTKVKAYLMRTANNLLISRLRRGNLVSVKARLEIKAIDRATGTIIATDRRTTVVVDLAEQIAGKTAIQQAAAEIAESLLPKIAAR